SHISLALVLLLTSEVWALGLGEIRLNSALNEPLRAEIELLSATPEELANLKIAMASAATFERYGLDRQSYLQNIQFLVIRSGSMGGYVIEIRSPAAITEPFLTFLVEASWSRGRLLREYTVLLDPPTFAPPVATAAPPVVTAPTRSTPTDSARIERVAPTPQISEPEPTPRVVRPAPTPEPVVDDSPYDMSDSGDHLVQRSETLWGITIRVRPDSRLTINQTMMAIFAANPEAFGGNINILRAGARLRIPSADEVFRISRGDALDQARRHHAAWQGSYAAPLDDTSSRSLTLVPPDDDYLDDDVGTDSQYGLDPQTREQEIEQRIADLEAADIPAQRSLIEIRNNELATLRQELSRIRGEVYELPVDDPFVDDADEDLVDAGLADDTLPDDEEILADDDADAIGVDDDEPVVDVTPQPVRDTIETPTRVEPGFVDRAIDALTSLWAMIIIAAVVIAGGVLFWFMRRDADDDDDEVEDLSSSLRELDADEVDADPLAATASLRAPVLVDDSIMVVEQESGFQPDVDATVDAPAPDFEVQAPAEFKAEAETEAEDEDPTSEFDALEDTFSSDTAMNLDQADPIAEADFHMAYGLYDQAADLINGALGVEPDRRDLLTKLCEIYFVWGDRDAFVDAAERLQASAGDAEFAEWDKIVIMGQQIAADDKLFAGATAAASPAIDLSFEVGMDEAGALDMEFAAEDDVQIDIVDLGAASGATQEIPESAAPDFELTAEMPVIEDGTAEMPVIEDGTAEMPALDATGETPTIEQQFDKLSGSAELPAIDEAIGGAIETMGEAGDETAEINLDDLGLDLDGLKETEIAALDDLDNLDATGKSEILADTGVNEELEDLDEVTGKNPEIDPDATGMQATLNVEPEATELATDVGFDQSLLDATGVTQVLSPDFVVETASDVAAALSDDDATMLASGLGADKTDAAPADQDETMLAGLDDEPEGDYEFAKTEALPADAFSGAAGLDETGELPAVASTDVDLDLDDLTAALQVSEIGDTIQQSRDDATVEQPRPDLPTDDDDIATMALAPGDMSEDLFDARTMTEVGTKLDLARAYVDMGDPAGARSILEEVLDEGDESQRQQAQQLLDSLPS
ncbi:MAG: hypothetical protein IIA11_03845, partial [Proteobacteria bacterium]|nr:hypothetical protein [Pseudomonadota bacterium]